MWAVVGRGFVAFAMGLVMFAVWMGLLRRGEDPLERAYDGLFLAPLTSLTFFLMASLYDSFAVWCAFFMAVTSFGVLSSFLCRRSLSYAHALCFPVLFFVLTLISEAVVLSPDVSEI
ncbi:hypothetical protein QOT17_000282 [Balamuthia mandrillaris]